MVPEETDNMCRRTAGQKGFVRNEKSNFQYRSGAPADSGGRRLCRQYAGLLRFHAVFQRLVDSDYYYTLYCKYHTARCERCQCCRPDWRSRPASGRLGCD